jgi:hypothetical protein
MSPSPLASIQIGDGTTDQKLIGAESPDEFLFSMERYFGPNSHESHRLRSGTLPDSCHTARILETILLDE